MPVTEARWFARENADNIRCQLCPRACLIKDGKSGLCRVRQNIKGQLKALTWGRFPAIAIDPIEKKPLYHFYPAARTLSLGTLGCNMHCLHCQNDSLSEPSGSDLAELKRLDLLAPETLVKMALDRKVPVIAWTYNEPLVNAEYLVSALPLLREAGLASVLVTAGLILPAPLREILPHLDAWRIDLKGWGDEFYKRLTGFPGWTTVLRNTLLAKEAGCHIEVVTNIISGWNDTQEELAAIANWMYTELGADTPWHVTASRPASQLRSIQATPAETILLARQIGQEAGLAYVYSGNIEIADGSDTNCPSCGTLLIQRRDFTVTENRLDASGTCPTCGKKISGFF